MPPIEIPPLGPSCDSTENAPDSLLNQCFVFVVRHLSTISHINRETHCYELYPGLALPRELCEKLVYFYNQNIGVLDDRFISLFNDTSVTSLKRVRLRNSSVTNEGLEALLKHNLVELDLEKCNNITEKSLSILNDHGENLTSLSVGVGVRLIPSTLYPGQNSATFGEAPKLRSLVLRNPMPGVKDPIYFNTQFQALPNLTHLDLSGYIDIEDFSFVKHFNILLSLVLHNVVKVQMGLTEICQLRSLR